MFETVDYFCVTNQTNSYCYYFKSTNITIIDYKNDRYVGSYLYKHMLHECVLHDYHEYPSIGYSFIGYYQESFPEKCVDNTHRKKYISRNGTYIKNNNSVWFFMFYILCEIFALNYYIISINILGNPVTDYNRLNQESEHNRVVEFKNISNQLKNDHYIISTNLNGICVYCQETLSVDIEDCLIGLPCGNWYHKKCIYTDEENIKKLKNKTLICPTCKIKI